MSGQLRNVDELRECVNRVFGPEGKARVVELRDLVATMAERIGTLDERLTELEKPRSKKPFGAHTESEGGRF